MNHGALSTLESAQTIEVGEHAPDHSWNTSNSFEDECSVSVSFAKKRVGEETKEHRHTSGDFISHYVRSASR